MGGDGGQVVGKGGGGEGVEGGSGWREVIPSEGSEEALGVLSAQDLIRVGIGSKCASIGSKCASIGFKCASIGFEGGWSQKAAEQMAEGRREAAIRLLRCDSHSTN